MAQWSMDPDDADDAHAALEAAYRHALSFHRGRGSLPPAATDGFDALMQGFGGPVPELGVPAGQAIEQLAAAAGPGLMGTAGPRFFGWVAGGSHPVGVAADWLTSVWGQNAACYEGAPAAAVAEQVAAQWLVDVLRLPGGCSVGITTGATMSNFVCLAAARSALLQRVGWDVEAEGMSGAPPITVFAGEEAHASVFAALRYLGFGERKVVRIPCDCAGRMRVEALRAALAQCRGPHIVIAQAGHIMTGAFDPVEAIARLASERGGWLHVDGAFGLWARACPARAPLAAGVELADSWATDAHKWLQAPYECGCAFVRDADAHRRAMTMGAGYLPPGGSECIRDPLEYTPELSRRARGFALWALLRAFGRRGIAAMIERHCSMAQRLAHRLGAEPGIEVLNEVELNQVVVRFGRHEPAARGDALTQATLEHIRQAGICFAHGAHWRGRRVMRVSVIAWPTTEDDIDRSADSMIEAWRATRQAADDAPRARAAEEAALACLTPAPCIDHEPT
ncbi:pyridoxal phosphate-dependent decarboxylase family protein [Paraburkholderia mimosarum]|uniref:pyridoxal phosphate-dependent decarboxylase family protein n=1 Tax=Paraburkholderia mimosarum TaxID=312026 RepID=UPI0003FC7DD3|nr:aminotransferase class V-fold PLP-dependent enzyme [Paraburkholderia mimosarum]